MDLARTTLETVSIRCAHTQLLKLIVISLCLCCLTNCPLLLSSPPLTSWDWLKAPALIHETEAWTRYATLHSILWSLSQSLYSMFTALAIHHYSSRSIAIGKDIFILLRLFCSFGISWGEAVDMLWRGHVRLCPPVHVVSLYTLQPGDVSLDSHQSCPNATEQSAWIKDVNTCCYGNRRTGMCEMTFSDCQAG